jgi:hypothetical protein
MMDQFCVERNQYGNMRIFLRILGTLEREVCLRQYDQKTGRFE